MSIDVETAHAFQSGTSWVVATALGTHMWRVGDRTASDPGDYFAWYGGMTFPLPAFDGVGVLGWSAPTLVGGVSYGAVRDGARIDLRARWAMPAGGASDRRYYHTVATLGPVDAVVLGFQDLGGGDLTVTPRARIRLSPDVVWDFELSVIAGHVSTGNGRGTTSGLLLSGVLAVQVVSRVLLFRAEAGASGTSVWADENVLPLFATARIAARIVVAKGYVLTPSVYAQVTYFPLADSVDESIGFGLGGVYEWAD